MTIYEYRETIEKLKEKSATRNDHFVYERVLELLDRVDKDCPCGAKIKRGDK